MLQLGVTMDFSIFLLHRYQEEKELRSSNEEAMTSAICKTMTSISASSLTTIAGFLALCAMRLTLGRDIGLVMAKGVALGVICTVVILPSLILTFDKWVEKYKHRTVIPKLKKLSYFVSNHSVPIVVIFILILIPFAIAQNKTEVYYTLFDSLPQDLTGIVGTNKLGEDFGMTTSHFILVHDDLTATEVSDLCDELKDVDGITQVVSLDSITGPGFQTELLPDSIMEILQSGGYKLILANSSYKTGTDAINNQLDEMISLIKTVDPEGVITGEGAMTKDLIEVADVDFKNVNVWSIMAVLVIIAVSFKSISIPALLVASIEAPSPSTWASRTSPVRSCLHCKHRHWHHPAGCYRGLLHPDDHPLPRGARLWPHTEGSRPAVAGALQPVHPDQRPDLLCRHRRCGCHQ